MYMGYCVGPYHLFSCGVGIRYGEADIYAAPQGEIPTEDTPLSKLAADLGVAELITPGRAEPTPAVDEATGAEAQYKAARIANTLQQ